MCSVMVIYHYKSVNGEFRREKYRGATELSVSYLFTSVPYSPEAMSIIERNWHTIKETVSAVLLHAGL